MIRSYYPTIQNGQTSQGLATTIWIYFISRNSVTAEIEIYLAALNPAYATDNTVCPLAPLDNASPLPTYFIPENPAYWNPVGEPVGANWQVFGDTLAVLFDSGFYAGEIETFYDLEESMSLTQTAAYDWMYQNIEFAQFVEVGNVTNNACTGAVDIDRTDVTSLDIALNFTGVPLNAVTPLTIPSNYQGINFYSSVCQTSSSRTFIGGADNAACFQALSFPYAHKSQTFVQNGQCQVTTIFTNAPEKK